MPTPRGGLEVNLTLFHTYEERVKEKLLLLSRKSRLLRISTKRSERTGREARIGNIVVYG